MANRAAQKRKLEQERVARERKAAANERRRRRLGYAVAVVLVAVVAVVLVGSVGGGQDDPPASSASAGEGPVHIHGLGVNPGDKALFIATHTGLFRMAQAQARPERVGQGDQDTMGFTVVGPDRFLGSGHPGALSSGPPLLGLIDSRDSGRSWTPVSLSGEADFHLLRAAGPRVYGADSSSGRFLVSSDGGRNFAERMPPGDLVDLAIDPRDGRRVVASNESGLQSSEDEGRTWKPLGRAPAGLLGWVPGGLFHVDAAGAVQASSDGGRTWQSRGPIGSQPVAFVAVEERSLYAALPDGTIRASTDGGRTWGTRSPP
ncbi:MAG: F510_1955 family glycosylhydrolase [Thermoleophilaceae bacterium]